LTVIDIAYGAVIAGAVAGMTYLIAPPIRDWIASATH